MSLTGLEHRGVGEEQEASRCENVRLPGGCAVKVVTFNCCSLNSFQAELVRDPRFKAGGGMGGFLSANGIDVLALQETKFSGEEHRSKDPRVAAAFRQLACVPGYESAWSFCTRKKGYAGVAIWVSDRLGPLVAVETSPIRGTANEWYAGDAPRAEGGPDRSGALPLSDADNEDFAVSGRAVLVDLGSWVILNLYVPNAGHIGEGKARERLREAARSSAGSSAGAGAGGSAAAGTPAAKDAAESDADGSTPAAAEGDAADAGGADAPDAAAPAAPAAAAPGGSSAAASGPSAARPLTTGRAALYANDTKPRLRVALAFLRAVRAKGEPEPQPLPCSRQLSLSYYHQLVRAA